MNLEIKMKELWTCNACGREFERQNQSHSCKLFPIELHFRGKENSKHLYEILCERVEQNIGAFKVESLECCIHFVSTFTFAAVRVLTDKLILDFALNRSIASKRFLKVGRLSKKRFLYYVEINNKQEIDVELINWLKMAHDKELEKILLV